MPLRNSVLTSAVACAAFLLASSSVLAQSVQTLGAGSTLFPFAPTAPTTITRSVAVTGTAAGITHSGIDNRPAWPRVLYGTSHGDRHSGVSDNRRHRVRLQADGRSYPCDHPDGPERVHQLAAMRGMRGLALATIAAAPTTCREGAQAGSALMLLAAQHDMVVAVGSGRWRWIDMYEQPVRERPITVAMHAVADALTTS